MAATKAWSGALTLAGFPVNVVAYPVSPTVKNPSFKMLDPKHKKPVSQVLVDIKDKTVARDETLSGVEARVGKDLKVVALTDEQVDTIKSADKSTSLEADTFSPRATVPLHLADRVFYIVPDDKVPGSEAPAGILWNGLRAGDLAYVTEWTKKAGQRTTLLAVVADEDGLLGYDLPYAENLYPRPSWRPEEDEKAAQTFHTFVSSVAEVEDFDHGRYVDTYLKRRAEVIEAVVKGEKVEVPSEEPAAANAPDLMAALEASVNTAQKKRAKKPAAKSRKKVSA